MNEWSNLPALSQEPYTTEERAYLQALLAHARIRPHYRSCYATAGRLCNAGEALKPPEGMTLEYGEGLAKSELGWIPHAIAVLNNKPVDITWGTRRLRQIDRASDNLARVEYRCARFSLEELTRARNESGRWGLGVTDEMDRDNPRTPLSVRTGSPRLSRLRLP